MSRTLVGAWIETRLRLKHLKWRLSRTLVGAWIETFIPNVPFHPSLVAPLWVRGLKHVDYDNHIVNCRSHPCGCVD